MQDNITNIEINEKQITIIGTAHVSQRSADEVKEIINEIQPDCVCIELDQERYDNLQNPKSWQELDLIKIIKNKKVASFMVNIILSSYQKRIAKKMEVNAGSEMIQGIQCAKEINAHIELVDRNIQTTFSRIFRKHSLWQKCKLVSSLILSAFDDEDVSEEDIENLKQSEMLEVALKEVQKEFPVVAQVLITERDMCLAYNIAHAKGNNVVAIVGAAHVPGIKKYINQEIDINELNQVPEKSVISKLSGWIIPAIIVGLILYGFTKSSSVGINQIVAWALWSGSLAALGTLVAGGHILSILTAFVAAPFTTINPFLAAGWFAGLVEATLKKPRVKDFETLSDDVMTLKGFYTNRVTHVLLVVLSANLFCSIGTIFGGWTLIQTLLK